jgi:hypothetical protein
MIDQNSRMVIQNVKDTMVGLQDETTNLINDVTMYWFVIWTIFEYESTWSLCNFPL